MPRLYSKLIMAAIAAIGVELIVYVAAAQGLVSSSTFFFFIIVWIVVFIMVLNTIRMLDARVRAKTR